MIIGIGNDLVDIRRIERLLERFDERFLARCFTLEEQERASQATSHESQSAIYAKRFAAKEACAKALGLGFSGGVRMHDIAISANEHGAPLLKLKAGALKRLGAIVPQGKEPVLHLSLSDDYPYAQAFVIIEAL